jgi:LAGLIDADG endonuclease
MVSFEINLHIKDISILHRIKDFFGVGSVTSRPGRLKCVYRVTNIADLLNVIIPHFISYPLITQKYYDFVLWSKVVKLMAAKQHLTPTGFTTILTYYASINTGLSSTVSAAFPNIVGVEKEGQPILPDNLNPYWVSGFTAGDGGFSIGIRPKTGQIYFRFHIAQHSRDVVLMNLFIKFFGCGQVNTRSNCDRCDFYVQDFSNIYDSIIPHFDNYPLHNIKHLDFADFKKAAELYKLGGRSNSNAIQQIISNMNSKRNHDQ